MIDRRPALVIRCLGVGDVVAAVEFVREHGLALTIKGGGHNISGLAVADGAVMLDMSLMRGVRVDPAARLAWAQAGCLLGDVDRETQLHGLAAPLGFVSTTGIAGLTLGGGFGYLTRRFGWTCDNVVAFDVVTADARIVRATETEHPDLFWALRGGGGNFGVVTGFTYRLAPIGPEILGGAIAWRAEEAPRILEAFRALDEDAPPELSVAAGMRKAPPVPWLPEAVHGQDIVAMFVCYTGPVAEGERLLAPLKRLGRPVRRCASAAPVPDAAVSPRRHPAEGPAVLLEIGVPPGTRGRFPPSPRGGTPSASSRRIHWSSSFPFTGRSSGSHRTIPRSATGTLAPSSTSRPRGSARPTTRRTSPGPGRRGRTCAGSRRAGPTSTSSPRRKGATASTRRTARTTNGSPP